MTSPALPRIGRGDGPKGWSDLAALGELPGRTCTAVPGCTAGAIVGTPDGYRCADHPPLDGPPGSRGWGYRLDWTPRTVVCREPRCHCGRCPFYGQGDTYGGTVGSVDLSKRRKAGGVEAGRQGRDVGQARSRAGAVLWSEKAAAALADLARLRTDFTADDLVRRVGLPNVSDVNANNAVGSAFSAASKAGIIGRTGRQVQSERPEANARWLAVWEGTGNL